MIREEYKIKIELEPHEAESLAREVVSSYLNVMKKKLQYLNDFMTAYEILKPFLNKYQSDVHRNIVEGYTRKKPYSIKLSKLQCLWLYLFIQDRKLVELYHIHTNVLGKHIQEFL